MTLVAIHDAILLKSEDEGIASAAGINVIVPNGIILVEGAGLVSLNGLALARSVARFTPAEEGGVYPGRGEEGPGEENGHHGLGCMDDGVHDGHEAAIDHANNLPLGPRFGTFALSLDMGTINVHILEDVVVG